MSDLQRSVLISLVVGGVCAAVMALSWVVLGPGGGV
jgi:hypothetical protein